MKRSTLYLLLMIMVFMLSACRQDKGEEDVNGDPPPSDNGETPNDDDPIDNDDPQATPLAEAWLSYYGSPKGNTSGNAANGGRVTYDFHEQLHYISSNQRIYAFNPMSGERTVLYELNVGSATHLTVYDTMLYYINTDQGELYRFDLEEDKLERLLGEDEGGVLFMYRHAHRIHVIHQGRFGLEWGHYVPRDNWIAGRTSNIRDFSEYGHRVLIRAEDSLTLQLRDGGTGSGSNWVNFETTHGVRTIKDFLFINFTQSYNNNVALILAKDDVSGVFIYYGDEEEPLVPIMTGNFDHFAHLNYDGTYVYFLNQHYLYRVKYDEPDTLERYQTLEHDIVELYVINHWVYYRRENSNIVYQVHPDTHTVTAFDD